MTMGSLTHNLSYRQPNLLGINCSPLTKWPNKPTNWATTWTTRVPDADPHSDGTENERRAARAIFGILKNKDDVTEGRRKLQAYNRQLRVLNLRLIESIRCSGHAASSRKKKCIWVSSRETLRKQTLGGTRNTRQNNTETCLKKLNYKNEVPSGEFWCSRSFGTSSSVSTDSVNKMFVFYI
jgi:hypothetical protein